jgi:hypothetical protein
MPKIKNLAALAAAVEAGRRYARTNPDKAGRYVDQAAAFVDKQTKGKYSGQIDGVVNKVKGAAGLPRPPRGAQAFDANAGYGRTTPVTPSSTPTSAYGTPSTPSTSAVPAPPPVSTPPVKTPPAGVDPKPAGDRSFPGSKDI